MYEFHRDNEGTSWRLIGLTARLCVELGLHRRETYEAMQDESERASTILLFWAIYVSVTMVVTVHLQHILTKLMSGTGSSLELRHWYAICAARCRHRPPASQTRRQVTVPQLHDPVLYTWCQGVALHSLTVFTVRRRGPDQHRGDGIPGLPNYSMASQYPCPSTIRASITGWTSVDASRTATVTGRPSPSHSAVPES